MSSLHESHSCHLQTLSHAVYPSVAQKDENLTAPDQEYRRDGGAQSNQIFNYSSLFVTCVTHRRHFHRLLQRRYLSDDRILTHMCAINISVATSQFSHCDLYPGMIKNMWGITFWATYVLWEVTSLISVSGDERFGEAFYFHLQVR